jgi:bifunctional non-homologous end joining protein LigD
MLKPMLASLIDAPLDDPALVYEPKYDGIRAIAEVPSGGRDVRLWSRLGNEKTAQFPEIAAALAAWARRRKEPLVLDGELVALNAAGEPTGFQQLQGRIHLTDEKTNTTLLSGTGGPGRVAFIAFDILRDGPTDLRERPLRERRARLERIFASAGSPLLRISEQVRGNGRAMYDRALASGWEGVIAKDVESKYKSGKRTPDWRKLKIVQEQEFVIGGWTEPRQTRAYFGALLLGVYEGAEAERGGRRERREIISKEDSAVSASKKLVYVGHTGTGFNERELARLMKLLKQVKTAQCPFTIRPRTNERPHWVEPVLVAQIKFTEWTTDNKLRHPVYAGLRDDKKAEDVRREGKTRHTAGTTVRLKSNATLVATSHNTVHPGTTENQKPPGIRHNRLGIPVSADSVSSVVDQLRAIEDSRRDGVLELPDGDRFPVTNLHKIFWPRQKFTKGDLFRYYVQMAPVLLPAIEDRPLVMKRYPNGVGGKPFYQHRAPEVPPGVRVETVAVAERRPQLVGGHLKTLLYTTQLAAISQDPWFSRVQSPKFSDYAALDLDPASGVSFKVVLDVARWIREELDALGAVGVPKTSGADGLHIYIPLPPRTPYEAGLLFCQIVATVVARKHPKQATVERTVAARGPRVYIDCLQNILGKTLASAYSARASDYAGVSAPLRWEEIDSGVRREDFTIVTMPARLAEAGDLWVRLRESKGVDLSSVSRYES